MESFKCASDKLLEYVSASTLLIYISYLIIAYMNIFLVTEIKLYDCVVYKHNRCSSIWITYVLFSLVSDRDAQVDLDDSHCRTDIPEPTTKVDHARIKDGLPGLLQHVDHAARRRGPQGNSGLVLE